ncbi:hypothetical protein [Methylobacterium gregans]|uniref:hypothetical protein n=1 Tax=Methylobacterium gregans TaxID=374424 RepID=UPI00361A7B77
MQAQSRDDLAAEVRNCINAVGGIRRQLDDTLEKLRQLWLIAPQMIGEGTIADLELQVKRLDIEEHDVLVLRTAKKLTQDEADAAVDMVESIARRSGIRFVTPVVLDACSDLSIERPEPRLPHEG